MNDIITGGGIAYNIIKNSQSVSNVGHIPFVNAIPNGASCENMSGWKKTSINLTCHDSIFIRRSIDKAPMFDIDIFINWFYDGRFRGAGSYISNATVSHVLKKCDSTLGFDLSVSFGNPYNAGDSEKYIKAHLPFAITLHVVQRLLGIRSSEDIWQWTGEIGGEPGDQGNTIGWYSWKRNKIR